jgi:hypothetical protein
MSRPLPKPAPSCAAWGGVLMVLLLLSSSGCIRVMALAGKMFIGDPKSVSRFETTTGVKLAEEQNGIIIHCTVPLTVQETVETLASDIEGELIRRMKSRKMSVIDENRVVEALDSHGGRYDTQVLMNEIPDARFLFEIRIERYTIREPHTPTMYHGRCSGTIVGYEFEGGGTGQDDSGPRRMAQVFEQEFDVDYPDGHPIPKDQISESSFRKKFVHEVTLRLGNMFYDVTSEELF